jgi:hypothetical protein
MSLSAERIAIANRAIQKTFEQSSISWQAMPHWDTGDPGQTFVRADRTTAADPDPKKDPDPEHAFGADPIPLGSDSVRFLMTLAQVTASTPDALLAAVLPRAVELARRFDDAVLDTLSKLPAVVTLAPGSSDAPTILKALINGRALLEDKGYRAPSCLIASTAHFIDLNQWTGVDVAAPGLLVGANANSLYRAGHLETVTGGPLMLMLGRRQQISQGCAGTASPGEEPVDIAVSVPPSLEVIGETAKGKIELAIRIRFATRIKDDHGVVVLHS